MTTLLITAAVLFLASMGIAYRLLRKPSHAPFTGEHVGSEYVTVRIGYRTHIERTREELAAGMQ